MSGVTPEGFVGRGLVEIQDDAAGALTSELSPAFDPEASPNKEFLGIFSDRVAALWELGQAVDAASDPNQAEGTHLVAICAYTGTEKDGPAPSTVTATVNLDAGFTLAAGSRAAVNGNPDAIFETVADVTNADGAPADVEVEMQAIEDGPIPAPAGLLTERVSTVSGWNSVTNATAATLGRLEEGDTALRIKRDQELAGPGGSSDPGLEADLRKVEGVSFVRVYSNRTMATNADGVPAKSFEVVIVGGADADIAATIWREHPSGISSHGTTTVNHIDEAGKTQAMKFTRPTTVTLHVAFDLYVRGSEYEGDGEVQTAAETYAAGKYSVGNDAIVAQLDAVALGVGGVVDKKSPTKLDTIDAPVATTNKTIGSREIASIVVANIDVTTTEAVTD